jgi:hypothetical protein
MSEAGAGGEVGVVYVRRDAGGCIEALSRRPVAGSDPDWSEIAGDAPEVLNFIAEIVGVDDALRHSDLPFVRVLEDVIDLLIDRAVIRFTDLPPPAQAKLLERRSQRQHHRQRLHLLGDEDDL